MEYKAILFLLLIELSFSIPISNGKRKVQDKDKFCFITLHDGNSSYDKNFIDASTEIGEELGVDIIIRSNIPEGEECYTAAKELAESGCKGIFADSFGHEKYLLRAAKEYPNIQFSHATGTLAHTEELSNFHNVFASIYEARYVTGIAAGMKLNEMINNKEIKESEAIIGYVGAHPYAEVISGFTAFYLGAKSVCNSATMKVRYTNSWYDEQLEKETAEKLIDEDKCKIISQHADSQGAPIACENNNIPNVYYNGENKQMTKSYLISQKINYKPYFEYFIKSTQSGTIMAYDWTGSLNDGSIIIYNASSIAAEGTQDAIDKAINDLKSRKIKVFNTSSFTVNGQKLTTYKADVDTDDNYEKDTEVISDGYFHESEFRSAPYFDIIIDGIDNIVGKDKFCFITLHDGNSSYDKNFIDASTEIGEELGVDIIIRSNIPEGEECYTAAKELAESGCKGIFADSFGHEKYLLRAAKEYPNIQFSHATGTLAHTEELSNFHNVFASIYEARYVTGIAAGMKLNEMINNKEIKESEAIIGYVGAHPYAEVISGFTAFYLGAKSVCNSATMKVRYTNSWYDEQLEKETAEKLIDEDKCKIISQHADSQGAPIACENNNIPNVYYNGENKQMTKSYLISQKINYKPYFEYFIKSTQSGTIMAYDWTGSLNDGSIIIYNASSIAAEGTQDAIDKAINDLKSRKIKVFNTSSFTVNGQKLTTYKADVDTDDNYEKDTEVISDGYFHESEFRSAPYFDIIIDGIDNIIETKTITDNTTNRYVKINKKKGLSAGAIVAIVASSVVTVAAVAAVIILCKPNIAQVAKPIDNSSTLHAIKV